MQLYHAGKGKYCERTLSGKEMVKKQRAIVLTEEPDEVVPDRFKSLDDETKAFCKEYIHDWNGSRAALKIFGGKESTARGKAYNLLSRKRVRDYCDYLNENIEEVTGVSRTWVMEQHLKIARGSIAHLHNTWIDRKDFEALTNDEKECIQEITTQTRTEYAETEDGEVAVSVDYVKIKLYDKQKSLDAITRLMGYDKAQRVDITSGGKTIGNGATTNVQVNIYNNAPPLAASEKEIQE